MILPVDEINPTVKILPAVALPIALTLPEVNKLPPVTVPTMVAYPLAIILAPETMLPYALTTPALLSTVVVPGVPKIPSKAYTLPVADMNPPVNKLPPAILAADVIFPTVLT